MVSVIKPYFSHIFKSLDFLWHHKGKVYILTVILIWIIFVLILLSRRKEIQVSIKSTTEMPLENSSWTIDQSTTESPASRHKLFTGYCLTEECNKTAQFYHENSKPEINLCKNFYDYACGNFHLKNPLKNGQKIITTTSKLQDEVDKKLIQQLLNETTNDLPPIKFVKKFFLECSRPENMIHNKMSEMKGLMNKILDAWEANKLMDIRFEEYLTSDILFSVRNIQGAKQNPVRVLSMPFKQFEIKSSSDTKKKEAYRRFLNVSIRLMDDAPSELYFIRNVFIMEEILSEMFDERRKKKTREQSIRKVETFSNSASSRSCLSPKENIWTEDYSYISGSKYTNFWKEERVKYNLIWRMIQLYGPILSDEFLEAEGAYMKTAYDWGTEESMGEIPFLERACFKFIQESAPLVLGRMYLQESNFDDEEKNRAIKFVKSLMSPLLREKDALFESDRTRPHVIPSEGGTNKRVKLFIKEIAEKRMYIGYPDWIMDDEQFTKSFAYDDRHSKLFDMAVELRRVANKVECEKLKSPATGGRLEWWPISPSMVTPQYLESQAMLIIPAAAFTDVLYDSNSPLYIKYGALGVAISRLIIFAIDAYERNVDGFYTQSAIHRHHGRAEDLKKHLIQNPPKEDYQKLNYLATLKQDIADQGGIWLAFHAFNTEMSTRERAELSLNNLARLDDKQMFFLSYANSFCAIVDRSEIIRAINQGDPYSPPRHRVNWSLANLPEFAYKCEKNTTMNPLKKFFFWETTERRG